MLAHVLAAMVVLGSAGSAWTQVVLPPAIPPPAAPPDHTVLGQEASGQVTRFDRGARTITLDTGAEYVLPPALDPAWAALREGTPVALRYNVDGGRNIVTQLRVLP